MSDHFQASISWRKNGKFVGGIIFRQPDDNPMTYDREQVKFSDCGVQCVYTPRKKP